MTITIPHYAALLGVSRQAVHEKIQKGKLQTVTIKINGKKFVYIEHPV